MKPLALPLAVLLAACTATFAAERPPNFVVIFIDDLGYADIGPFGATKQKTPNLDRMAREGMKLTSFYAAPVCSVSRAQLMTAPPKRLCQARGMVTWRRICQRFAPSSAAACSKSGSTPRKPAIAAFT